MARSTAGGRRYALAPLLAVGLIALIGLILVATSLPTLAQSSSTSKQLTATTTAKVSSEGRELDAHGCYRDIARHRSCGQIVNCRIDYSFEAEGKSFSGSATLRRNCDEVPEGTELPVFYDPQKATRSSLNDPNSTPANSGIFTVAAGALLMAFGGGLGLAIVARRKRRAI